MQTEQRSFDNINGWSHKHIDCDAQLVLAFAAPGLVEEKTSYDSLRFFYPNAEIVLIGTAGEIFDVEVCDNSISANALTFEKTEVKVIAKTVDDITNSFNVGKTLGNCIYKKSLSYTLIFSDGIGVNGAQLLSGIKTILGSNVGITGGLAGDAGKGEKTFISLNGIQTKNNLAIIIGLYGNSLIVGNASISGWDRFGIERHITKSIGNTVYELDGKPILSLYKEYLGDKTNDIPGAASLFPISIYKDNQKDFIIRTLLGTNEKNGTVIFSGDIPQGYKASFMKTDFGKLVAGAGKAAKKSLKKNQTPSFALLVSCLGRRVILKQRTEDEIDAVREIIGQECAIGGFYSYGEIGTTGEDGQCELHNQTITIALFSEK